MGFFEKFGQPQKIKSSGKQNVKQLLAKNIVDQLALLDGETVIGTKGKSIRSWFNKGKFSPTIGAFGVFDGKVLPVKSGQEKDMLLGFKEAFENGEFDSLITSLEAKREVALRNLASAPRKRKAGS